MKKTPDRHFHLEMTCTKRHVTFVWALLECLLFTGLIFGWPWFLSTLRRNKYFLGVCHLRGFVFCPSKPGYPAGICTVFSSSISLNFCTSSGNVTLQTPRKYLFLRNVDKNHGQPNINPVNRRHSNKEKLEVIHAVVFLVRNALVFPLGIFLDMYGTTRTRLLTM
jgi:hypothetical protein